MDEVKPSLQLIKWLILSLYLHPVVCVPDILCITISTISVSCNIVLVLLVIVLLVIIIRKKRMLTFSECEAGDKNLFEHNKNNFYSRSTNNIGTVERCDIEQPQDNDDDIYETCGDIGNNQTKKMPPTCQSKRECNKKGSFKVDSYENPDDMKAERRNFQDTQKEPIKMKNINKRKPQSANKPQQLQRQESNEENYEDPDQFNQLPIQQDNYEDPDEWRQAPKQHERRNIIREKSVNEEHGQFEDRAMKTNVKKIDPIKKSKFEMMLINQKQNQGFAPNFRTGIKPKNG